MGGCVKLREFQAGENLFVHIDDDVFEGLISLEVLNLVCMLSKKLIAMVSRLNRPKSEIKGPFLKS